MTHAEQLYQLVQQKKGYLEQLHNCSKNQIPYVETDNMEAILEILAAKQRLLLEIESLDRQIAQYHVDDPEDRVWPSLEMREQCRVMISHSDHLVRETLELDRFAEQCLLDKKNTAQQQLQQFVDQSQVQNAYRQQKIRTAEPGYCHIDLGTK